MARHQNVPAPFRVHLDTVGGERIVFVIIAKSPDDARREAIRRAPGAIIAKVKLDREARP